MAVKRRFVLNRIQAQQSAVVQGMVLRWFTNQIAQTLQLTETHRRVFKSDLELQFFMANMYSGRIIQWAGDHPLCITGRGVLHLRTGFTGAIPTVLREHSQKHTGK